MIDLSHKGKKIICQNRFKEGQEHVLLFEKMGQPNENTTTIIYKNVLLVPIFPKGLDLSSLHPKKSGQCFVWLMFLPPSGCLMRWKRIIRSNQTPPHKKIWKAGTQWTFFVQRARRIGSAPRIISWDCSSHKLGQAKKSEANTEVSEPTTLIMDQTEARRSYFFILLPDQTEYQFQL